jgi:penicillin-binding protein-related factor A (putative recombinase)
MVAAANRGKYAEGEVKKFLKKMEAANCAHHRFPDAHSGSMVTAPADFMFMQAGIFRLLEVKEIQHDFRMPYDNFSPDQVARMRMWQAAGAHAWVLVYHKNLKAWRLIPAEWFLNRPKLSASGKPVGSWVLDEFPLVTLAEAFTGMKK